MLTLKLSAKCETRENLVAVLDRASSMISAGCVCATRESEGTAAFGFEVNYGDKTDSWVSFSRLIEGIALKFDELNPPAGASR
jgi:hypothetical protein